MPLAPGTRFGSYEVRSLLGTGGMGEVYRAHDHKLGRDVAIKVLREEYAQDRDRLARFEQEARAASALNYPHIVTIFDIGDVEGRRYIAMEMISGRTLRALLQAGPLDVPALLDLASQSADGLAKAHDAGIVHRDLKPENLMVTEDGLVKILDFGLAKLMPRPFEDVADAVTISHLPTRSGMLVGTVEYMSPEQAAGLPVDQRTDQFALGLVLYEMATGERPFQRRTVAQTLAAIIEADAAPLERPGMPAGLAAVVERCLAKEPAARFASTRELAQALRRLKTDPAATLEHLRPALPAPAPPQASAPLAPRPADGRDYYVQTDRRIKRMSEQRLRRRLRQGTYSGLELVRRDGDERWEVLHDQPVFREEVPVSGDVRDAARWRLIQRFVMHLATFVGMGIFLTASSGHVPFWMAFWGIGLVSHGFQVLPAITALMREGKLHLPGAMARQMEIASRQLARVPGTAGSKALLSPSFVEEAERVRSLLRHRSGKDRAKGLLEEVDRLEASMSALAVKQADIEEQTSTEELERLKESERDAQAKLSGAESAYDRQLFQRQLDVLTNRRRAIEKALVLLDRMRVRRSMAEHQLKQLRLDLSQAEARRMDAPELSSRILDIRHEVDAFDEADELLARE